MTTRRLNQIALSVSDLQHSQRWYRDLFGYVESGGTYMFRDFLGMAKGVGLPETDTEGWWLLDCQDYFQLEVWQYKKPEPKPLAAQWRPCDIGYTMFGVHVADFDATLERLRLRHVELLSEPIGAPGSRRVCVRDPDGILVEVMEDDPRGAQHRERPYDCTSATRFVTLSVPDLAVARRVWVEALGVQEADGTALHTPEHEALWGLPGARRESLLLDAGDIFIEIVQYLDPVGEPWPEGYLISDLGMLNIALVVESQEEHKELLERCRAVGTNPITTDTPLLAKLWFPRYYEDPMGFSIELLYHFAPGKKMPVNPFDFVELGFAPERPPVTRARAAALCAAPPAQVWAVLTDHAHMADWAPFARSEVLQPGPDGDVGTVRKLSGGPARLTLTETVVTAEPPYRLEYTAKGAPLQWMYHGFVTLEPTAGGGTNIIWEAQFRSPLPGSGAITTVMLKQLVAGLSKAAERHPAR